MKLPNESNITVKPSSPSNASVEASQVSSAATPKQSQASLPASIQTLINTWAKVQSSQTLPPSQNQQVLSQLAQLIGQGPIPDTYNQGPSVSEKLNLSTLAQSLDKTSPLSDTLKLVLIKLMSVKGPINILSERPIQIGAHVLLTQTAQGKLSLQAAQPPAVLNTFRAQFVTQNFNPSPIPLIDSHQASTKETHLGFKLTPLPTTTLKSDVPLAPQSLQQAITNSGQNFEAKLAQLLNTATTKHANPAQETQQTLSSPDKHSDTSKSIANKIIQVEQNIQKWVSLFQQKLSAQSDKSTQHQVPNSSTNNLNFSKPTPSVQNEKPLVDIHAAPSRAPTTHSALANDHKDWLINNQKQLLEQLSTQLLQRKNSFIPNWSALQTQGQALGSNIKTFQDLTQWLTLLMLPKVNSDGQGEPIWPKALSVQPQLQQTLTALLSSLNQSGDDNEATLLRQLLNINQTLSKLTHDQVQNRLWQGQGEPTQFQLSLPYVHQSHVQWCEFECKQQQAHTHEKEKTLGWHLILRFAQNSEHAFAIESHLKQEQLALTLWANQAKQLQHLHQNIPLIKHKLEHAGFKIDSITSKHGAPKPLNQPIQQSLIDVHT